MNNQSDDNVYYDILISNVSSNDKQPVVVNYLDSRRSIPLINNTTDYALSIIRFTIDTTVLPVFVPVIQQNQANINLTIYSVTLSYTDTGSGVTYNFQQFMEFVPQDKSAALPIAPSSNPPYYVQDNSTLYYFVYNYSYLISLMNTTLVDATNGLIAACALGGVVIAPTPPVETFDLTTLVATINIDTTFFGTNETGKINTSFNQAMAQLFNSMPMNVLSFAATLGKQFQLTNNYLINTDGSFKTQITQEYSSVGSCNPVASIVFTSTSLPIIASQIALPSIYLNGVVVNNSSTSGSFNVITDLVASEFVYKPFLIYNSTAQYRYVSLLPNRAIRHVDIQIYFQLKDGQFVPLRLPTGATATLKLLFSKPFMNIK